MVPNYSISYCFHTNQTSEKRTTSLQGTKPYSLYWVPKCPLFVTNTNTQMKKKAGTIDLATDAVISLTQTELVSRQAVPIARSTPRVNLKPSESRYQTVQSVETVYICHRSLWSPFCMVGVVSNDHTHQNYYYNYFNINFFIFFY